MRKNKAHSTYSVYVGAEHLELFELLEDMKWKERSSVSELIIKAVEEYVKNHKEGNPNFNITQFIDETFLARPALIKQRRDGRLILIRLIKKN